MRKTFYFSIVMAYAFQCATGAPLHEDSNLNLHLHKHDGSLSHPPPLLEDDAPSGWRVSALLEFNSHDMWHDMAGYDHPVIKLDPDIAYETPQSGTFTFASEIFLQQLGRPREKRFGGFSEMDYILSWNRDFGPLNVNMGHTWYTYPAEHTDNLHESYAGICYETPLVTPFTSVCYDWNQSYGWFFRSGLTREFHLTDSFRMVPEVSASYGSSRYCKSYFDTERGTVTGGTALLFLHYQVTDHLCVGATLGFSTIIDSGLRNGSPATRENSKSLDTLWGGLSLGIDF